MWCWVYHASADAIPKRRSATMLQSHVVWEQGIVNCEPYNSIMLVRDVMKFRQFVSQLLKSGAELYVHSNWIMESLKTLTDCRLFVSQGAIFSLQFVRSATLHWNMQLSFLYGVFYFILFYFIRDFSPFKRQWMVNETTINSTETET